MIGLAACASTRPSSSIPAIGDSSDEQAVISEGDSSQPCYSPDGGRLLYVSAARATHAQPQIYERDLASGEERRLTFQDGSTFSPKYHPKEPWIVYSSTTDELKENPLLLQPEVAASPLPPAFQQPSEIYLHSLNGLEITRVTTRLGYDGEPQFSPDGRQLQWSRAVKNRLQVVSLTRATRALQAVPNLGVNPADYVSSPDSKTHAWIEWDESFQTNKLRMKIGREPAFEVNADHVVGKVDLAFSPDSQFLAWSQFNAIGQRFEIWVMNLKDKCPHMMVGSDSADRRHPVFSPGMKGLTYTTIRRERSRIVQLPFVPPTGPCSTDD